jgi:hypothetical protein
MTSISGYGQDYEHKIGPKTARSFCGMYPLPKMGYETLVAIAPDAYGFKQRLYVQNISGTFVLASSTTKKQDWEEVFKVKVSK